MGPKLGSVLPHSMKKRWTLHVDTCVDTCVGDCYFAKIELADAFRRRDWITQRREFRGLVCLVRLHRCPADVSPGVSFYRKAESRALDAFGGLDDQ